MPTFADQLPDLSPKSLTRRECRASSLAQVERIAMPAQSLLHLRTVQVGLFKDFKSAKTASERVALAGALAKIVEARRVLLKIPGPGRESVKSGPTITVPQVFDVSQLGEESAPESGN